MNAYYLNCHCSTLKPKFAMDFLLSAVVQERAFLLVNDFLFCSLILRISSPFVMLLAALQSVFPQTEMITFISLSKKNKEQQLKNLAMLVTGIRLYNKECRKGGSSIDDCK